MLTAAELSHVIGSEYLVQFDKIKVMCLVDDARQVWGRIDVHVSPVGGSGSQWVCFDRVGKVEYLQKAVQ